MRAFTVAWLIARTNVPLRQTVFVAAFLSLAAPLIVKGIGWILLLGPNNGLINVWLRAAFGLDGTPIELFGLGGMIFVEGLLWTPVALLLALPPLSAMDPALEEAALMCGASRWQTLARVTLPLARPAIFAVLLLSFIRALEAFEVPLLIGIPGGVITVTTALYQSMHSGFLPRYGEASAYRHHHRQGLSPLAHRPRPLEIRLRAVGADHPARARRAAAAAAVGLVPADLHRARARRS